MIEHRVGELRLKVRTDADAPELVRQAAEAFVRASIERCAALLEERHPGRVVLLGRLPLRLALAESRLDDGEEIEATARASADAIEADAAPARIDAFDSAGPVFFDDEAQWRASHLLARARGQAAWFHAALEDEGADPWAGLLLPERRALAGAVLRRLAQADVLAEVLAAQPPLAVAVLAAAWGCDVLADADDRAAPVAEVDALARIARTWPPLATVPRRLALHIHAAALLDASALHDASVRQLAAAVARLASAEAGAGREPLVATHDDPREAPATAPTDLSAVDAAMARTGLAGLVPLIGLLEELGVAEALWQACLPESVVIVAALRTLADATHADDALFAGLPGAAAALPAIHADQVGEVAVAACAALCAALPRRGLAELPEVVLSCIDRSDGRLLVAAAEGAPVAFFAWPAGTPDALRAGLNAFLDAWSSTAIVSASPALARLDAKGRLLARPDATGAGLALPRAASSPAAALLAVVAGAPATLFAARLGALRGEPPAAFVATWFQRKAGLRTTQDALEVLLDADERDLALRRAGLDRDPGWVPWLARKVGFVFTQPPAPSASPTQQVVGDDA